MRLAVTADLHFGLQEAGDAATRALVRVLGDLEPDAFLIAGDIGSGRDFDRCLALFRDLSCPRLLIPGNHDIWTQAPVPASLYLYETGLSESARKYGFLYLDTQPFIAGDLAVVGNINWYDYSFADPDLERDFPGAGRMLQAKLFPQGAHNDGRYVRLGMTDAEFTESVVRRFREHMAALPESVTRVVAAMHHPPLEQLFYPSALTTPAQRFWRAYTGNRRMQDAVLSDSRVRIVLCGHTHAYTAADVAGRRCINIGGDYGWKRLLLLDTDTGEEQWHDFGRKQP